MPPCKSPLKRRLTHGERGFRGVSFFPMFEDPSSNILNNTFEILLYLIIRKSQESKTSFFKITLSFLILISAFLMRRAINFDNELKSGRKKINNVIPQWFLAMKIVSEHLLTLEFPPEKNFGASAVLPKHACNLLESWMVQRKSSMHGQ